MQYWLWYGHLRAYNVLNSSAELTNLNSLFQSQPAPTLILMRGYYLETYTFFKANNVLGKVINNSYLFSPLGNMSTHL